MRGSAKLKLKELAQIFCFVLSLDMAGSDIRLLEAAVTQLRQQQTHTVAFVEALNELSEACFGIDAARSLQLSQEAYETAVLLQDARQQAVS